MKCPGCGAFIYPAWEQCHACGGALKCAALLKNVEVVTDPPGPATEHDFIIAYDEATTRLNAAWTHGVKIKELPNYPEIKRFEEAVDAVWLEARQGGRHEGLFGQFLEALFAWEATLIEGLSAREKRK